MALSAIRRLGLDDQPVPVVLGGGVLTARDPLLTSEITKRFADEAPLATPCIVDIPPGGRRSPARPGLHRGRAQRPDPAARRLPAGARAAMIISR